MENRAVHDDGSLVNMGIDVFPTLCTYAGIEADPSLPGESLQPVIQGKGNLSGRYVVSENDLYEAYEKSLGIEGRMLRQGDYKYCIYNRGGNPEQLFNLRDDPGEMNNLAYDKAYHSRVSGFRSLLKEWIAENGDHFDSPLL